jgi:hypothetical protein
MEQSTWWEIWDHSWILPHLNLIMLFLSMMPPLTYFSTKRFPDLISTIFVTILFVVRPGSQICCVILKLASDKKCIFYREMDCMEHIIVFAWSRVHGGKSGIIHGYYLT